MAQRKKTDTGATPKKRTRSTTTKTTRKKSTKKTAAKEQPIVGNEEVPSPPIVDSLIPPSIPSIPRIPGHMMVDGQLVPVNGIAPIEPLPPVPPPQPPPVVVPLTPPPTVHTTADVREQARIERLQRRQRDRVNGSNTPVSPPVVAPAPVAMVVPTKQEEQVQVVPNNQQLADLAAKSLPFTPPPDTQQRVVVPVRADGHDDIQVNIPELFQYKIQVHESRMRDLAAPIRADLKAKAEQWLREAIATTLSQNQQYQEAKTATESCVNELLEQLNPQIPDGYAVVLISAKEGKATCRYAPDQAGKRFKID